MSSPWYNGGVLSPSFTELFSKLTARVTPLFVWSAAGFAAVLACVMTWILLYHWRAYGSNMRHIKVVMRIYFVGLAVLLSGLVLSASVLHAP